MNIQIVPFMYYDGIPTMRDSAIKDIYIQMLQDGTLATVFYDGTIKDPDAFLKFFKAPGRISMVAHVDKELRPAAWGWMDNFEIDMCRCHFCVFSKYWGDPAVEICMKLSDKAKQAANVDMLIGYIPSWNTRAINFAKKCGGIEVGMLPFGGRDMKGGLSPITIVYYM